MSDGTVKGGQTLGTVSLPVSIIAYCNTTSWDWILLEI